MTRRTGPRRAPDEERLHRKQRLAATLRIFDRLGFAEGAGGHVTARDPLEPDQFWINPLGVPFGHVRVSDLLLIDAAGSVVAGTGTVNPAGDMIHSQIHAARPDVDAAAHTHSVYGRAWSALARPLDPLTQDACAFYGDHAVSGEFGGVVLDREEAKRIAVCLGPAKAIIMRNHGLLTVGGSVEEAAWWFVALERACQVQLHAEAAGTPVPMPADIAAATRAKMGTPGMGRLNFRPMYADIVRAEPGLLD